MSLDDLPLFSPRAPDEGERRKSEGMALADAAEPQAWRDAADAAIRILAASGREFGANEVRDLVGDPTHSNAMGAAFSRANKAGLIKYLRHAPSNRPQLHRCAIRVWVGR